MLLGDGNLSCLPELADSGERRVENTDHHLRRQYPRGERALDRLRGPSELSVSTGALELAYQSLRQNFGR